MATKLSWLQQLLEDARAFWDESAFRAHGELSRIQKFVQFAILVGKSFVRNRCPVRASALAYATLLALIPMLAIAMSISSALLKGQSEERIGEFIEKLVASVVPPAVLSTNVAEAGTNPAAMPDDEAEMKFPAAVTNGPAATTDQPTNTIASSVTAGVTNAAPTEPIDLSRLAKEPEVVAARDAASRYIKDFIQKTRSGTLGITGSVLLIFVAISMLTRIEDTFNDIWGVEQGRSWFTRIVVYWTVITLAPVLLIVALGLATGPRLAGTKAALMKMPPFMMDLVFPFLPVAMLCLFLTIFYVLIPNTKVRWSAALVGGSVGGILWHLNNVFSVLFVSRVVSNSKVYGSLALVPVFMIGLYFTWLIMLFGAQVAYAFQNRALYYQQKLAENVNQRGREFVALRLMTCLSQRFENGLPPATVQEMSVELGVPTRLVQQVLQTLLAARLVIKVSGGEPAYTPARPLEAINCHHILMAMRATQGQELLTRDEPVRAEVFGEFARIQDAEKQAATRVSMLDLVHRAQARLEIAPPPPVEKEIKLTPALVPAKAPAPEVEPKPEAPAEDHAPSATAVGTPHVAETAASREPKQSAAASAARPVAEPTTDDDRNFPL